MKKLPMLLLLAAPYLLIGCSFLSAKSDSAVFFCVGLILFAAILLFNMAYAFALPRLGYEERRLLFWNMLLKLCNIPVYLLVFLSVLLMHVLILPLIPLLVLFDYFLLLPSTMYGISGMLRCRRNGALSRKALAVNVLAQFVFCLDVFSAVYCYRRTRKHVSKK